MVTPDSLIPFLVAVREGDLDAVKAYLTEAPSLLDARWPPGINGVTGFHLAVESGDEALVDLFVELGADPCAGHDPPLVQAARVDDAELVSRLLPRADQQGKTAALIAALDEGHDATAALLLRAGAQARVAAREGVLERAISGGRLAVVRLLIENGADPETTVDCAVSPFEGDVQVGVTPLIVAAAHGQLEIVRYLLERGATATRRCQDSPWGNVSASEAAQQGGHDQVVRLLAEFHRGRRPRG